MRGGTGLGDSLRSPPGRVGARVGTHRPAGIRFDRCREAYASFRPRSNE